MRTSESTKEINAALAKAQAKMAGAKKDATNPHFKSRYADLASVWDACREALTANGIAVVQMTAPSEKDEIIVETRLAHSSGEWYEGTLSLPVSKADAQGYGSALTYARRYGLAAAAGVAPEDDDGNAAAMAKPETKSRNLSPAEFQGHANKIGNALNEAELKSAYVLAYRAAEAVGDRQALSRFTDLKEQRKEVLTPALASQA